MPACLVKWLRDPYETTDWMVP